MASSVVPGGKLTVGDVLNSFAEGLQRNGGLVLQGAGIMAAIALAGYILLPASAQSVGSLLQIPVQYWLYEKLLRADGGGPQPGAARRILPFVGLSLVIGLGVGLGMILLIVPGLILAARWSVAIPIFVGEEQSVADSMSRSWELTRPSQWSIVLALVVFGLLFGVVYGALVFATVLVSALIGSEWMLSLISGGMAAVYTSFATSLYRRLGAGSAAYGQVFG